MSQGYFQFLTNWAILRAFREKFHRISLYRWARLHEALLRKSLRLHWPSDGPFLETGVTFNAFDNRLWISIYALIRSRRGSYRPAARQDMKSPRCHLQEVVQIYLESWPWGLLVCRLSHQIDEDITSTIRDIIPRIITNRSLPLLMWLHDTRCAWKSSQVSTDSTQNCDVFGKLFLKIPCWFLFLYLFTFSYRISHSYTFLMCTCDNPQNCWQYS